MKLLNGYWHSLLVAVFVLIPLVSARTSGLTLNLECGKEVSGSFLVTLSNDEESCAVFSTVGAAREVSAAFTMLSEGDDTMIDDAKQELASNFGVRIMFPDSAFAKGQSFQVVDKRYAASKQEHGTWTDRPQIRNVSWTDASVGDKVHSRSWVHGQEEYQDTSFKQLMLTTIGGLYKVCLVNAAPATAPKRTIRFRGVVELPNTVHDCAQAPGLDHVELRPHNPASTMSAGGRKLGDATPSSDPTDQNYPTLGDSPFGDLPNSMPSAFLPSSMPTSLPTSLPTTMPTSTPTTMPSSLPSSTPTSLPTTLPSAFSDRVLPSSMPTSLPTILPTTVPQRQDYNEFSSVPTSLPTTLPTVADGESDFMEGSTRYADIFVASGGAAATLPVDANTSYTKNFAGAMWSRPFGFLFANSPEDSTQFAAFISERTLTPANAAAATTEGIALEASTVTIAVDSLNPTKSASSVKVYYQALDEKGRTVVATPFSVTAELVTADEASSTTINCGSAATSSGIGSCSGSVPQAWFSSIEEITVNIVVKLMRSSGDDGLTSNTQQVVLAPYPTFTPPSTANMIASFPQKLYHAGDTITLTVVANTASQALTSWVVTLNYNTSVLRYVSMSTARDYIAAVVVTSTGKLSMSTSGVSSGVSDAKVTGSSIAIMTVNMAVVNGVGADVLHHSVMNLFVNSMVNVFSIKFASDMYAVMRDDRSGTNYDAQLYVRKDKITGVFAYSDRVDVLNLAPLSGATAGPQVTVKGLYSKQGDLRTLTHQANNVTCSISALSATMLSVDASCNVLLAESLSVGGDVPIAITVDGGFTAQTSMTVWYPTAAEVVVTDPILNALRVEGGTPNQGCVAYQKSRVLVRVTFSSGTASATGDFTDLVTLVPIDETLVDIDTAGRAQGVVYARGLAEGTTSIDIQTYGAVAVTTAEVTVTAVPVWVSSLNLVSYTGVTMAVESSADYYEVVTPTVRFNDLLTSEGTSAYVTAILRMSDGAWIDVTRELTALTSMFSGITTSNDQQSAAGPRVTVAVGAESHQGTAFSGTVGICGVAYTGYGSVNMVMPSVESISVTKSTSIVTSTDDLARLSPFNVPTTVAFTVVVTYADGSTRTVTNDDRTSYTVVGDAASTNLVQMTDHVASVNSASTGYSGGMYSTFEVQVSFQGVSTTVSADIVTLHHIALQTVAYPAYTGSSSISKTTIGKLNCDDGDSVYQRLQAVTMGYLSNNVNGNPKDVSSVVSYSVSQTGAYIANADGIINGLSAGTADLEVTYGTSTSAVSIVVSSAVVTPTSITIRSTGLLAGPTLSGLVGTTKTLTVAVTFSDDTIYTDAVSGSSSAWLSVDRLLAFESGSPSVISITSAGELELSTNNYDSVTITATAVCSAGAAATTSLGIYANLEPAAFDVDLGKSTGAPFGFVGVGSTFTVPVLIQSGTKDITSFQVIVTFDDAALQVVSDAQCSIGGGWSSSWDCTTNDPTNQVLVAGSCGLLPATQCRTKGLIEVAQIQFTALRAGITSISGLIVKIQDSAANGVANAAIFAGTGDVSVTARRRHLMSETPRLVLNERGEEVLFSPDLPMEENENYHDIVTQRSIGRKLSTISLAALTAEHHARSSRRQLSTTSCLGGDANGDGVFDVTDVVTVQYYVGGAISSDAMTVCQLAEMDADRNGLVDGVDIQYLLRVVTKKYRLLKNIHITHGHSDLRVTSFMMDDAGAAVAFDGQTGVRFEVYGQNTFSVSVGTDRGFNDIGAKVVDAAYDTTPGVFAIAGSASVDNTASLEVAVIITSFDALGASADSRQFVYFCTPSVDACVSVYGAGMSAFKPFASFPWIPVGGFIATVEDEAICGLVDATLVGIHTSYGKWECDSYGIPVTPPCTDNWQGITCNNEGKIISLSIPGAGIKGFIPSALFQLTDLVYVDLSLNDMQGTIPTTISAVDSLEYLDLTGNKFANPMPSAIGAMKSLKYLFMSNAQLTGTIPSALGNSTSLVGVVLSMNNFTGTVPTSIAALNKVQMLDLSENSLSGTIPSVLGAMTALRGLDLSFNSLQGTVPVSMFTMPALTLFRASENLNLRGPFPNGVQDATLVLQDSAYTDIIYDPSSETI